MSVADTAPVAALKLAAPLSVAPSNSSTAPAGCEESAADRVEVSVTVEPCAAGLAGLAVIVLNEVAVLGAGGVG